MEQLLGMAMPIIMFPATFLTSISCLIIPEFSRYYVKKDYIKIKEYTKKLLVYSFLFSSTLSILFMFFGTKIGFLIYNDLEAGLYIKLLSPLVPLMYLDIMVDSILKGLDSQVSVLFVSILDLAVSILFICIFVPMFGIAGFIASMFVSEFINFSLSFYKLYMKEHSW